MIFKIFSILYNLLKELIKIITEVFILPVISMFLGIIIRMFNKNEHNPPHFHAYYQGSEAIFNMEGEIIKGEFPKRQTKFVAAWAELHKEELLANWELAVENQPLYNIEPLR